MRISAKAAVKHKYFEGVVNMTPKFWTVIFMFYNFDFKFVYKCCLILNNCRKYLISAWVFDSRYLKMKYILKMVSNDIFIKTLMHVSVDSTTMNYAMHVTVADCNQ